MTVNDMGDLNDRKRPRREGYEPLVQSSRKDYSSRSVTSASTNDLSLLEVAFFPQAANTLDHTDQPLQGQGRQ